MKSFESEFESETRNLELEEEEFSGSGPEKKPLKWLPIKNKYMFYSIIAFLERSREQGAGDDLIESFYSKLPMFETPDNQKAFFESLVDVKHIEKEVYRPLVKEHKKSLRENARNLLKKDKKGKKSPDIESKPAEPANAEPANAGLAKTKPVNAEPVNAGPAKTKPTNEPTEPANGPTEPANEPTEPANAEPAKKKEVKPKIVKEKDPPKPRGRKQKTVNIEYNNDESLDTVV